MPTAHHLENSRSQRVVWLLEELELPYEVVRYARHPGTKLAPAALKAMHPLGKSPVVTTDDGSVLAESGPIVETLIEQHGKGKLAPAAGTPDHLRCRQWLHFAEGSAMPPLLMKRVFDRIEAAKMSFFLKPVVRGVAAKVRAAVIAPNLRTQLDFMGGELSQRDWFVGDQFAGADVQMGFPLEAAAARDGLDATRPRLLGWLERIHTRPAHRRALERGGPYELLC